ncbi:unnamed protein product [Effrenium voratum]|nr:unnamed protein product [Effrenium voratum]
MPQISMPATAKFRRSRIPQAARHSLGKVPELLAMISEHRFEVLNEAGGLESLAAKAGRMELGETETSPEQVAFPKAQALAFLDSGDRHSIAISFLDVRPRGLLTPLSFDESNEAEDKAALVASKVEQAAEAADEAEVQAEAAEEAELIVVGIATVFAGVAWYTTYVTWQTYQRWLNMKKRAALCVGAARAANAVS